VRKTPHVVSLLAEDSRRIENGAAQEKRPGSGRKRSIVGWFNLIDTSAGGSGQLLFLPVSVFEIILLPFWLLFRGFKTPEALSK